MGQKRKQNSFKPSETTSKTKNDLSKSASSTEGIAQHKSHGIRDFLSILPFLPRSKQKTKSNQGKIAATSRFKITPSCSLTANETRKLIRLYEHHENLYNRQHPAYGDAFFENVCYAKIASCFPNKTINELQSRIHELRLLFEHEYIIIENGYRRFGEILKPTIKYYNEFLFLLPYLPYSWDSGAYLPPKETCTDDFKSKESRTSDVSDGTPPQIVGSDSGPGNPQTDLEFKRSTAGKCFFFKKKDKEKDKENGKEKDKQQVKTDASIKQQNSKTSVVKVKESESKQGLADGKKTAAKEQKPERQSEQPNDVRVEAKNESSKNRKEQTAAAKEPTLKQLNSRASVDKDRGSEAKQPLALGKKTAANRQSDDQKEQTAAAKEGTLKQQNSKASVVKPNDGVSKNRASVGNKTSAKQQQNAGKLPEQSSNLQGSSENKNLEAKQDPETYGAALSHTGPSKSRSQSGNTELRRQSKVPDTEAQAATFGSSSRRQSRHSVVAPPQDNRRQSMQPNTDATLGSSSRKPSKYSIGAQSQDHRRQSMQPNTESALGSSSRKQSKHSIHAQSQDHRRQPNTESALGSSSRKQSKHSEVAQSPDQRRQSMQPDSETVCKRPDKCRRCVAKRMAQEPAATHASPSANSLEHMSSTRMQYDEADDYGSQEEFEKRETPPASTAKRDTYPGNREQLDILCEMIKMELSESPDFIYYDAKWRIIEILREVQKRNMMHHKSEPGNSGKLQEQQWHSSRTNSRLEDQQSQCDCSSAPNGRRQLITSQRARAPMFTTCPYCCKR
ncbi:hypothetical protein KR093_002257 [Drosophila rubida]|uniref:MADF domain-containing protein n=1 Tax=Drosophila rubida TaxID=30044 RepID=A0AAD4PJ81_9MUSC|nr:hypothetical protein KR093_002257 [Drosophila rubida]